MNFDIDNMPKIVTWAVKICKTDNELEALKEKFLKFQFDIKHNPIVFEKFTRYLPKKITKINNEIGAVDCDCSDDDFQNAVIAYFEDNIRETT